MLQPPKLHPSLRQRQRLHKQSLGLFRNLHLLTCSRALADGNLRSWCYWQLELCKHSQPSQSVQT